MPVNAHEGAQHEPQRRTQSPLVLRVLTGLQQGAQARMKHQRLLVGNLQSECDVVLDVGTPRPHTCLVRAGRDGWTVLSTAGDLWHGENWLTPHEPHSIASGDVLTLGGVSFCIADTRSIDWSQVRPPAVQLTPPKASASAASPRPHPQAPSPGMTMVRRLMGKLGLKRREPMTDSSPRHASPFSWYLAGILLVLGTLSIGAAIYSYRPPSQQATQPNAAIDLPETARRLLAKQPWARELTVQPDPLHPRRMVVGGYLAERRYSGELQFVLQQESIEAESRWVAVDDLGLNLSQRLNVSVDQLRYGGQGSFELHAARAQLEGLDRSIRRLLQDSPAVQAVSVLLSDKVSPDAASMLPTQPLPTIVRYQRAQDQPGGVSVSGLEALQPAQKVQRYVVREIRLGNLPSVVLDNGARYFEGSSLPGGATLVQIGVQQLRVQAGAEVAIVPIDSGVQVAGKAQGARTRSASQVQ